MFTVQYVKSKQRVPFNSEQPNPEVLHYKGSPSTFVKNLCGIWYKYFIKFWKFSGAISPHKIPNCMKGPSSVPPSAPTLAV